MKKNIHGKSRKQFKLLPNFNSVEKYDGNFLR